MNESSSIVIYVGGTSISVWQDDQRLAVRTLPLHHLPESFDERRARLMIRIREIAIDIRKQITAHDTISLVMGSPWVTYHTRTLEHARENPFVFSRELEESLIAEEYQQIKKEITKNIGEHNDILIGLHVQKHFLNGHQVENPFGVATYRCALSLVLAFADRAITHDILAVLEVVFQRDDIRVQSYWQWMSHEQDIPDTLMFVLGALTTDVMWVQNGYVQHTASLPSGYEAHLAQRDLPHSKQEIVHELAQWIRTSTHVLHEWSQHHVLPHRIEVITDDERAYGSAQILEQEIASLPFFTERPSIVHPQDL